MSAGGERRCVALLRAVNVGGTGRLGMAELRDLAEAIGWRSATTILQSGNLIFAAQGDGPTLEDTLEAALGDRLSCPTQVMVRSAAQWRALVAANPFPGFAERDPSHLLLVVTKGESGVGSSVVALRAPLDQEQIAVVDGGAYVTYPQGIGRSKLTTAVLERGMGVPVTARNWNTVLKIAAALAG